MKKQIVVLFGTVLLAALFSIVPAAAQTQMKIGIVDIEAVMNQSAAGRNANALLTEFINSRQADLDALQRQISDLESRLVQSEGIEHAERSALQQQIDQLIDDYYDRMNTYQQEVDQYVERLQQTLLSEIAYVLQQYGDEHGYDLIIDFGAVVYYRLAYDITEEIIKLYDEMWVAATVQSQATE